MKTPTASSTASTAWPAASNPSSPSIQVTDTMIRSARPGLRVPTLRRARSLRFRRPTVRHRWPLPYDSWAGLDGRGVVHVAQGTAQLVPARVIAPTLEALAVATSSSWSAPTIARSNAPAPDTPAAAAFLPYDELLPRTAVFVTNGGYGGVQYAMRYGVPIVATGGKEDKPEVGARVAWSGVGRRIRTRAAITKGIAPQHPCRTRSAAVP